MSAPEREPSGDRYVPASPVFFRLIRRAMGLFIAALGVLAVFVPAPLQEPADIGKVPNPAKSAWFLLWIQELVSYSRHAVYPAIALGLFFLALPYTRWGRRECGEEGPRRLVAAVSVAIFLAIVALTVVAFFFRGRNWELG